MLVGDRIGFNGLDYLHAAAVGARKGMRKKKLVTGAAPTKIAPGIVAAGPVPTPPPGLPIAVPQEMVEMSPKKGKKKDWDVFDSGSIF